MASKSTPTRKTADPTPAPAKSTPPATRDNTRGGVVATPTPTPAQMAAVRERLERTR